MKDVTITTTVRALSKRHCIAKSTLKSSSRSLKRLNLISFGEGSAARLTDFGTFIVKVLDGASDE